MKSFFTLRGHYDEEDSSLIPLHNQSGEIIGSINKDIMEGLNDIQQATWNTIAVSFTESYNVAEKALFDSHEFMSRIGLPEYFALLLIDAQSLVIKQSIPLEEEAVEDALNAYFNLFGMRSTNRLYKVSAKEEGLYRDELRVDFTNNLNLVKSATSARNFEISEEQLIRENSEVGERTSHVREFVEGEDNESTQTESLEDSLTESQTDTYEEDTTDADSPTDNLLFGTSTADSDSIESESISLDNAVKVTAEGQHADYFTPTVDFSVIEGQRQQGTQQVEQKSNPIEYTQAHKVAEMMAQQEVLAGQSESAVTTDTSGDPFEINITQSSDFVQTDLNGNETEITGSDSLDDIFALTGQNESSESKQSVKGSFGAHAESSMPQPEDLFGSLDISGLSINHEDTIGEETLTESVEPAESKEYQETATQETDTTIDYVDKSVDEVISLDDNAQSTPTEQQSASIESSAPIDEPNNSVEQSSGTEGQSVDTDGETSSIEQSVSDSEVFTNPEFDAEPREHYEEGDNEVIKPTITSPRQSYKYVPTDENNSTGQEHPSEQSTEPVEQSFIEQQDSQQTEIAEYAFVEQSVQQEPTGEYTISTGTDPIDNPSLTDHTAPIDNPTVSNHTTQLDIPTEYETRAQPVEPAYHYNEEMGGKLGRGTAHYETPVDLNSLVGIIKDLQNQVAQLNSKKSERELQLEMELLQAREQIKVLSRPSTQVNVDTTSHNFEYYKQENEVRVNTEPTTIESPIEIVINKGLRGKQFDVGFNEIVTLTDKHVEEITKETTHYTYNPFDR